MDPVDDWEKVSLHVNPARAPLTAIKEGVPNSFKTWSALSNSRMTLEESAAQTLDPSDPQTANLHCVHQDKRLPAYRISVTNPNPDNTMWMAFKLPDGDYEMVPIDTICTANISAVPDSYLGEEQAEALRRRRLAAHTRNTNTVDPLNMTVETPTKKRKVADSTQAIRDAEVIVEEPEIEVLSEVEEEDQLPEDEKPSEPSVSDDEELEDNLPPVADLNLEEVE